jgi:hypothetical protein
VKVSTLLDLVGSLAVIAALVVFLWPYTAAGALAAGGAGLLLVSWFTDGAPGAGRARRGVRSWWARVGTAAAQLRQIGGNR